MPRVLPITLVAVLMVLPLKLGSLVEGFPVIAQQFDREFGREFGGHERPWATDLNAAPATPPAQAATAAVEPAPPPAACADPALVAALTEQKADVATRTRRLAEAEAVLAATEARVGTQIQRLMALKREIEGLVRERAAMQQDDVKRMVTIYEAMKPKDAARILDELDTGLAIDVLDRMPERRSAPIIAELADTKAREVTRVIMQRRALPGDRTATN